MGKSFKANIRIFILLALLPVMAALTACDRTDPDPQEDFFVRSFSVSGTVYDASESLPGKPLGDVTITMTAYWYYDTDRESPLYSAVVQTGSDGKYQFYKAWNMTMQNVFYVLKVSDSSKSRSVHFKPVEQELYLRAHTDAYDNIMRSYEVRDNDFYLFPESL